MHALTLVQRHRTRGAAGIDRELDPREPAGREFGERGTEQGLRGTSSASFSEDAQVRDVAASLVLQGDEFARGAAIDVGEVQPCAGAVMIA